MLRGVGRDVPVLETTALVYPIQLLIAPWVSYHLPPDFLRYQMAVSESRYFTFAIPAVCSFLIPMHVARSRLPRLDQVMSFNAGPRVFTAGVIICLIGFGFSLITPYVPSSVGFVCFLGSELRFVGAMYCYFSRHRQRRWVLAAVLGLTFLSSLANAMFHQLLIWGVILVSLVLAREIRRPQLAIRVAVLVIGFLIMVTLESFKGSYREALRTQQQVSVIDAILEVASTTSLEPARLLDVLRVRLNQGWIVSNVLNHIPANAPYINGETFRAAFEDSLLPRFFFEKRVSAGGRDNFRRMTGLQISDNTSMGVSTIGESYANFGPDLGCLAMFGFGSLFAAGYSLFCKRSSRNVLFLLWLPLVFSQAIKAETELGVVLNHLVKAAIFALVMCPLLHQWLFGKATRSIEQGTATKPLATHLRSHL